MNERNTIMTEQPNDEREIEDTCPACNSKNMDGVIASTMDGSTLPYYHLWCLDCKHEYNVHFTKAECEKYRVKPLHDNPHFHP
jgi:formate dehydrogenase maturation protein FdhE